MDFSVYSWGSWLKKSNGSWAHGYIIGSGLPMKFVRSDGSLINVFQQSTHLVDEQLIAEIPSTQENLSADQAFLISKQLIDASLAGNYNLRTVRRTELTEKAGGHDVVVLDTIGELCKIYSIADVVYVGGSLVARGGHNILEPAAHGKAILVGPNMFNFKDSYALYSGRGACDTVYDSADLGDKLISLLGDEAAREAMGTQALAIIRENQGASVRSVEHIKELLANIGQQSRGDKS
jgi:3-deoxy-D-manno-octulosonic-acid transferase